MDNYIVPIRRFGKATHIVVCITPDLENLEWLEYIALDSVDNLTDYSTEFMKEIIFCNEADWHRLNTKNLNQ
jgi:hypothetical protein